MIYGPVTKFVGEYRETCVFFFFFFSKEILPNHRLRSTWTMDGTLRFCSRDLSYFLSNDATTRSPYRKIILQFSLRLSNACNFATGTSYRAKPHPTGDNTESTEEKQKLFTT